MASERSSAAAGDAGDAAGPRPLHPRSFKLRFGACREPGRSYVSLVKPRALPATVTGKFYSRAGAGAGAGAEEEEVAEDETRALRRIEALFARGPRELYPSPRTAAQEYGWWSAEPEQTQRARETRCDRRLSHHIRDSAWLKARLRVLAADDKLKHR